MGNEMKNLAVCMFLSATLMCGGTFANECFLVKDKETFLKKEGDCQKAYSPHSTFKIALSLMGFDSGILTTETTPTFPFKTNYAHHINVCKGDHNPKTWIRDSCVWFSQVLTQKLGMKKFRKYVTDFNYGNKDVSGDPGKNNGLTQSWLRSSIRITPEEQVQFLQRLVDQKLPVSPGALKLTKNILFIQQLPGGWDLYAKTGNGRYSGELQHGWFAGWIEKDDRKIVFVQHLVDESKQSTYASFRAKNEAMTKLWYIIDKLEK
jgi:beta-lactamase class D